MSSIVIILTYLAKIGFWRTRWLWTVAPGCCHFQSFFSYLWTGCPELLYPHLLPSPHLQHRAAPSFPTSLPPFISHCSLQPIWPLAAQPRAAFEEPIRWRLTSPLFACLGSAHGTVKRKTLSLRGEIFAKLLYLFVFSSWFHFEAFSNVEWMMSFRFD